MLLQTVNLILSFLVLFVVGDDDIGLCCLCDDCTNAVNGRSNLFIAQGHTCSSMALHMADPSVAAAGSNQCKTFQKLYRDSCCNPYFNPIPVSQQLTQPPRPNLPQGTEPWCDLCTDGDFPGIPNTVTAILYMSGNPTCKDLYWMGRTGNIPDQLCNPLVDYFQEPCGCGEYNPIHQKSAEGGGSSGNNGGSGNSGSYYPPVRKVPPPDTKEKLYKGRVRGSTRVLSRGS